MIKIYLISLINLLKMCKCNKDTDLDDACSPFNNIKQFKKCPIRTDTLYYYMEETILSDSDDKDELHDIDDYDAVIKIKEESKKYGLTKDDANHIMYLHFENSLDIPIHNDKHTIYTYENTLTISMEEYIQLYIKLLQNKSKTTYYSIQGSGQKLSKIFLDKQNRNLMATNIKGKTYILQIPKEE